MIISELMTYCKIYNYAVKLFCSICNLSKIILSHGPRVTAICALFLQGIGMCRLGQSSRKRLKVCADNPTPLHLEVFFFCINWFQSKKSRATSLVSSRSVFASCTGPLVVGLWWHSHAAVCQVNKENFYLTLLQHVITLNNKMLMTLCICSHVFVSEDVSIRRISLATMQADLQLPPIPLSWMFCTVVVGEGYETSKNYRGTTQCLKLGNVCFQRACSPSFLRDDGAM